MVEAELDLLERRPEDALAKADTLLAERPHDADALGVRALALRDQGRILDAIDVLGQGVESGGGDRLRFIRASLLTMTGQQDAALAELATLGPFSTALPVVKLMCAEVLSQRGDYAQSVDWFDRFLQTDPGNPIGIGERLIACFSRDGVYEDVAGEMDALVAEPPTDPMVAAWLERQPPAQYPVIRGHVLFFRGQLRLLAEKFEDAIPDLRQAEAMLPPALGPALVTVPLARALVSSDQPGRGARGHRLGAAGRRGNDRRPDLEGASARPQEPPGGSAGGCLGGARRDAQGPGHTSVARLDSRFAGTVRGGPEEPP